MVPWQRVNEHEYPIVVRSFNRFVLYLANLCFAVVIAQFARHTTRAVLNISVRIVDTNCIDLMCFGNGYK